jgi:hypothetical protein
MELSKILNDYSTCLEIKGAILKHKVQPTKQDVITMVGTNANPTPNLCKMILEHGNDEQQREVVAFLIGQLAEYRQIGMSGESNEAAEMLLEHFARLEEKALEAAEKAVAAASDTKVSAKAGK